MPALGRLIDFAQQLVPPGLVSASKRLGMYPWGFKGDFPSWEAASERAGRGYADPAIAEDNARRTQAFIATLGSTPTDNRSLRLLAAFLLATQGKSNREVQVLDFGGALGGHYFVLRALLPAFRLRWVVCETEPMCRVGRERFADEQLSFVSSLNEVAPADVVLASGSLQYLPAMTETLRSLLALAPFTIVDRLPLSCADRDRVAMHIVPPWLYRGVRMPVWFLSQNTWRRETEGRVILHWRGDEQVQLASEPITYQGFLLGGHDQPRGSQTQVP